MRSGNQIAKQLSEIGNSFVAIGAGVLGIAVVLAFVILIAR